MTIKQLSVFLENKTGRINDVVRTLGQKRCSPHIGTERHKHARLQYG